MKKGFYFVENSDGHSLLFCYNGKKDIEVLGSGGEWFSVVEALKNNGVGFREYLQHNRELGSRVFYLGN
jgi:hypothetical protein